MTRDIGLDDLIKAFRVEEILPERHLTSGELILLYRSTLNKTLLSVFPL